MTLPAWWRLLRAHGLRVSLTRLAIAASVTVATLGNLPLGLLQSAIYSRRLRAVKIAPDPVFILGHWRSGTTHLHELLALDDRFAAPTVFECLAPHHCMLTDRLYPRMFSWLLPAKRPMDNMALAFERPQEDELALMALGAPSPYWSLAYPGETPGQAYLALRDLPDPEHCGWERVFGEFLRLLTYRNPGRRLVLKSPPHTARLALLARMFPEARFLHIVRDPYAVFASTVHLWRSNEALNALTSNPNDDEALESRVLRGLPQLYADFDAARASLLPGRFHQLRYEDLIRDPLTALEQCYTALGLGTFPGAQPRVRSYLAGLSGYRANEYALSAEGRAAVRESWGPIFRDWGYSA